MVERKFTMPEVTRALEAGRLKECFGAGTAAVVMPINGRFWSRYIALQSCYTKFANVYSHSVSGAIMVNASEP